MKVREFSDSLESEKVKKILEKIDGISQIVINASQGYSLNFIADRDKDLITKLKVE